MRNQDPLWHWNITDCEVMKASKSKKVLRCLDAGTGRFRLVKIYYYPGLWQKVKYLFRPSKAHRELALAARIREKGIPTIVPEKVRNVRKWGLLKESAVFAEYLPDCMNLEEALIRKGVSGGWLKKQIVREYGKLARLIHDQGVYQDDFDPNNILFQKQAGSTFQLYFVDFERTRIVREFSLQRRIHSLAKLNRMGRHLSRTDQMRFLNAYLGPGATRRERREWISGIRREEDKVRLRDQRRAARQCTSENSRTGVFRHDGYQGYYRKRHHSREYFSRSDMIFLAQSLDKFLLDDGSGLPTDHQVLNLDVKSGARPEQFQVRVFEGGGLGYRLQRIAGRTPLLRAWKADNGCLKNRSASFLPVAALEKKTGLNRYHGFLIRKQ